MPQRLQIVLCEKITLQDGDGSILLTLHPPQSLPRLPSSSFKSDNPTYVMSFDTEAAAGCDALIYLGSHGRAHPAQLEKLPEESFRNYARDRLGSLG